MKRILSIAVTAALLGFSSPALAQESNYTPGTVWNFAMIKVADGQWENYMDWLATAWKQQEELGKKEGLVVSYHVFAVNNPRDGEANLVLGVEYKDYATTAQQMAFQKKLEAAWKADPHKMDEQSGDRTKMREVMGSVEAQEMNLK